MGVFGQTAARCAAAVMAAAAAARGEMERATPESQGVDSRAVSAWIDACERTFAGPFAGEENGRKTGRLHGFVIVRHGKVVAEGSWAPFDTLHQTHMLYSHSKSFTSSAIGFLVDDGKLDLDERVLDIFPEHAPAAPSDNLKSLRVRDLLTMNVGAASDPQRKTPDTDWAALFLSGDVTRAPGTRFQYDSCATYMLAATVERRTGRGLMDYLDEKMFRRIGIEKAWTTVSPQGIACGGWGMNMTTRDLARFGLLYLQKGRWNGETVLSPEWVTLATARQTWSGRGVGDAAAAAKADTDWGQGYGFQFWRCRHNAYRADGASGQFTVVLPDQDAVVSLHAGLGAMPTELNLIWDYLLPGMKDGTLPPNAAAAAALEQRCASLAIPPCGGEPANRAAFEGRTLRFAPNARGLASVRFDRADGGWTCTLVTPAGAQTFPAANGAWANGTARVDTAAYENLGYLIGEQPVAASAGGDGRGGVRMRAYFTGTTFYLDVAVDATGRPSGKFFGMNGCDLSPAAP